MEEKMKIAVAAPIQLGGSLFTAEQLSRISSITNNNMKIELTPFKQLYVEVLVDHKQDVEKYLIDSGLAVYPAGFVTKSLIACNFCKGADEAGLNTASKLNEVLAGIETPSPLKIAYAGCALGTSEPLMKDIGIVKMRETFDIYVGGEPKGIKPSIGMLIVSGVSEENIADIVLALIHYYKEHAKGKEKFSRFISRVTVDRLKEIILKD